MDARLVAFAGPIKGTSITFGDAPVSIGRDEDNQVALPDLLVSRHHCRVATAEGHVTIEDLASHNGTFVNGVPVRQRALQHGDQIRIGDSLFIVLLGDDAVSEAPGVAEPLEGIGAARTTVVLKPEDARYLGLERDVPVPGTEGRTAQDLRALLRIARAVHAVRDRSALQRRLLELVAEVVPAQFGASVLVSAPDRPFDATVSWSRDPRRSSPISRTIVRQVLSDGVAVLANDLAGDPELRDATGVGLERIAAVLCAPLTLRDRRLGVLYLGTRDAHTPFDEAHLQLVAGVASIAALALDNATHVESLEEETRRLHADLDLDHRMVGDGEKAREIQAFIARVAPADTTALILGESGTGKELVARAIHRASPRAAKPFVSVNCAALTEPLLESELFGHERGAFTGAIAQKRGKLELAHQGTVFLDEIGDMAPNIQAKLLRVLQEREFERVGGTRPLKVDIRVLAASNRDLERAIRDGQFRQDLYYRLNVISIRLPPLRDRRDDIPLLASFFVERYAARCKRRVTEFSPEARERLLRYDWPGNVRELENAIEHAVVLGTTETILLEDLPEAVIDVESGDGDQPGSGYHEVLAQTKKRLVLEAVAASGGNLSEAATRLGLYPTSLHRLIRQLDLRDRIRER